MGYLELQGCEPRFHYNRKGEQELNDAGVAAMMQAETENEKLEARPRMREFLGNPRFPLKGSFKGGYRYRSHWAAVSWVAVEEFYLRYHNMDTW